MGRVREEEGMIYNFYTEFASAEEFTKINRSTEWRDVCDWCLKNGVRISCFPVAIDDKIQAFFFCEANGMSEQEVFERLKKAVPDVRATDQEIPIAIDWDRIIDGSRFSKCENDKEDVKVIEPVSLVGLGDYELRNSWILD